MSGLEVEARGSRVEEHPKVYEAIEVTYRVRGKGMDPRAVEWFIPNREAKVESPR